MSIGTVNHSEGPTIAERMKTTQAYLLLTLVALALSCSWIPKIDQEDYCYADYGIYFLVESCLTKII